jgi:hypothetical protein
MYDWHVAHVTCTKFGGLMASQTLLNALLSWFLGTSGALLILFVEIRSCGCHWSPIHIKDDDHAIYLVLGNGDR